MRNQLLRLTILLLLGLLFIPALNAEADHETYELRVYYLEFPPYYYTNADKEPDGFLLKLADRIFHEAEVRPIWAPMPAKRILQELHSLTPVASVGWFKTPEREEFARFSLPIYQNKPMAILYLSRLESRFSGKEHLADVLKDKTLELGMLEGYSLGAIVDDSIRQEKPRTRKVVGEYPQLVGMLGMGRFDYIFIAPEEADRLVRESELDPGYFRSRELLGIPAGNLRYLMFSRGVPESVRARVNQAISHLGIEF